MSYFRINKIITLLTLAGLLFAFSFYLKYGHEVISFPYEIDYGEGIVWQQALLMLTPNAYGSIEKIPFIVFHYPPLYHFITLCLSEMTAIDFLSAGRIVSISATLIISIIIGNIVSESLPEKTEIRIRITARLLSGLSIFSVLPIFYWSPLGRVDMLAEALTLTGFWLGLKAYQRQRLIYLASALFVAAVYTKQSMIAAPMATFGIMLWLNPKTAFKGISACITGGLIILGIASYLTGGKFIDHVFYYNINTFDFDRLRLLVPLMAEHAGIVMSALIAFSFAIMKFGFIFFTENISQARKKIASEKFLTTLLTISSFFAISTPLLILFAKEGANLNYTIEWFIASVILIGNFVFSSMYSINKNNSNANAFKPILQIRIFLVPILLISHIIFFSKHLASSEWIDKSPKRMIELNEVCNMIRLASKPVISDEMVLILRCGKSVQWESAIFAQLEKKKLWDPGLLIKKIQSREFSMFITIGVKGDSVFDSRYSPKIAAAIDSAYPAKRRIGGLTIHTPDSSIEIN